MLPDSLAKSLSKTSKSERTPALDALVTSYSLRNINKFHQPGSALRAAKALENAQHVVLMTGFSVAAKMPETDGPPGTAAFGHALKELGKVVTYVTDPANAPVLKAAVAAIDPEAAKFARFVTFDAAHDGAAPQKANTLLDKLKPDAVVAIELPSRSTDGSRHNMRGINIDPFNGPVDEILIQAGKRKLTTVGVGDGGNEAGMGGLKGIPKALDGSKMAAVVKADIPVTAWNSNFGAEAIGAVMLQRAGKLDALHTPDQQAAMINATFQAGAVDGVSRKTAPSALDADGKGGGSGVDGFPPDVHAGMLTMAKSIVAQTIKPGFVAQKTPDKEGPFVVAAFDSSNGGLIAARNLESYLEHRAPFPVRLVVMADHGNAPYGTKEPGRLIALVGDALKRAEDIKVDAVAMACNTACTSFPDSKKGLKNPEAVLDLIDVTSKAIAKLGGERPVIFSTPATAKDPMYPNKVADASGGKIKNMQAIGCLEWAPMINDLKHLDNAEGPDKKALDDSIAKYVSKVPTDATSVWLCCTHYPVLKQKIEKQMAATGLGHIPVIDPMEHQAEALIEHLHKNGGNIDRSNRDPSKSPIVLTTGTNVEDVQRSAQALLARNGAAAPPVLYTPFDKPLSMSLIGDLLLKPENSSRTTTAATSAPQSTPSRMPQPAARATDRALASTSLQ